MSVRLADRSFQYAVGIAENMLIKVVKKKQLNLGVGTERMIINIDSAMKHSYSNDDTCFSIDVIDEILEEDFDALLNEDPDSESDTKEPPFEKITINTDYKINTSLEEPPTDLEVKPLPDNLEYVFLEEPSFLPVIISYQLSKEKKNKLLSVLKKNKEAFAWKTTDLPGEKGIMKLLDTGIIYPIADSPWVSPIHCVPKKGGITVVTNKNDELVPTRTITVGERMPFRLCNAAATFQRCMLAIFHDKIKESVKVFMDDFSVFGNSFNTCLNNLDKMLQHCKDAHLVLNWEKCHFMVKEGIVLGHK
ncbi:DNA-directed DNA polymerase, partial [Tanacetum coccineum]